MEADIRDRFKQKHGGARHAGTSYERPRILFMGEAVAISHVARPNMLAAYLHDENYDVCFACDFRYNHLISENGFKMVELYSLPSHVVLDRLRRNEPVFDADTLDRYVQQDLKILREFKPDIVVGDQRHSLAVSSRLAGVPYVNIIDAHWSAFVDSELELLETPVTNFIGLPLSNLLFKLIEPIASVFFTMPLNVVRVRYGLPELSPNIRTFFTYGDCIVYPNAPELFALKEQLPPNHLFIGPLIWSPRVEKPAWWDKLPDTRPVVYVSLGSTGEPGLLRTVFKVLGELPVTVIAATAARKNIESLPANVFIADFLPGTEAAQRARLVISNGGSMSSQQALAAGTPYLALISNVDQLLFTKSVSRTGTCEFIREGEVNENNLLEVIGRMLTQEKYRLAASSLASRMMASESCGKFKGVIDSIIEERAQGDSARVFHVA